MKKCEYLFVGQENKSNDFSGTDWQAPPALTDVSHHFLDAALENSGVFEHYEEITSVSHLAYFWFRLQYTSAAFTKSLRLSQFNNYRTVKIEF
jgi:hypothetical protein